MSYVPMNADPIDISSWFDPRPLWGCGFCGQVVEVDDPKAGNCCATAREWMRRLDATIGIKPAPPPTRDPVRWERVVRRWEAKHAPAVVMSRWDNREIF